MKMPFDSIFKVASKTSVEVRVRTKMGGITINPPGSVDGVRIAGINWIDYIGHDLEVEVKKTKPPTFIIKGVY